MSWDDVLVGVQLLMILLCFMYVYRYSCLLLSMHICFMLFPLFDLSFVDFPSVLWYCWLGPLTCENRLPYYLYCVGGDVKHCTIQSNQGKAVIAVREYVSWDDGLVGVLWLMICWLEARLSLLAESMCFEMMVWLVYSGWWSVGSRQGRHCWQRVCVLRWCFVLCTVADALLARGKAVTAGREYVFWDDVLIGVQWLMICWLEARLSLLAESMCFEMMFW